jgi:hypothetical protein
MNGQRNELGGVDDRAAADGQDEIDLVFPGKADGLQTGFVFRVGFDATEFEYLLSGQRGRDLIVDAVGLDRALAIDQQNS